MMESGPRRMSHCPDFVLPTWLVPEACHVGSSHSPRRITSEIAPMSTVHINGCAALAHPSLK